MKKLILFVPVVLLFLFVCSFASAQQVGTYIPSNCGVTDGLVMDSAGNLFGCDFEGETVYKITPDSNITSFATGFNHPNGMTMGVNDTIYLASTRDHAIFQIAPDGVVQQYGPTIQNPNGVIFEPDSDTLIVASYALNSIRKLAPDGTILPWFSGGDINGPLGMAYDEDGTLYIANFNDGKVLKVEGNTLTLLATVPSGPLWGENYACGFLTYCNGYLYATGIATNYVYRISLEGDLIEFAGCGIGGHVDGDASTARFSQPNGIVPDLDGERLFISDFTTQSIRTITNLTSDISYNQDHTPSDFKLLPSYPNPFNLSVSIPFRLNTADHLQVMVTNILGQEIIKIADEYYLPGYHSLTWDGNSKTGLPVSSGEYIISVKTSDRISIQKISLIK